MGLQEEIERRERFDRLVEHGISGGQMAPAELTPGGETQPTGNQQQPSQGAGNQQQQQEPAYSELAAAFLKEVPDAQKSVLEPFLKKWDSGVTKKFQEIHTQYQPFKELGADPETLGQAMHLFKTLDENPQVIYDILKKELEGQATTPGQVTTNAPVTQQTDDVELPPALVSRLEQMEQVLTKLAEITISGQQQSKQSQEEAALDQYLEELKQSHGDFNVDFVLTQIAKGMEGPDAVAAWNQAVQQHASTLKGGEQQQTITTPILGGGGGVPANEGDVTKMEAKDVKSLVSDILAKTAAEGG